MPLTCILKYTTSEEEKMSDTDSEDATLTVQFVIALCVAQLALYAFWIGFPVLNTLHPVITNVGWWIILVLAGNGLLAYTLLASVAKPTSVARIDIHIILSWLFFVLDAAVLVGIVLILLFYNNTGFSGASPFNDYRWCCVFFGNAYCANTGPCVPPVSGPSELSINSEFSMHIAVAIAQFVLVLGHMGANRLMRTSGVIRVTKDRAKEGRYLVVGYILLFLLAFALWVGLVLLNTTHVHGYPRFPIPLSPNTFESTRYSLQYWTVAALMLNAVPLYLFAVALACNQRRFSGIAYLWSAVLMAIVSLVIGIILLFAGPLGNCNLSFTGGSLCNDYEWCCEYFASSPELCPNVTPCPVAPTLSFWGNTEYVMHIVTAFVFAVVHAIGIWLQFRAKRYGVVKQD